MADKKETQKERAARLTKERLIKNGVKAGATKRKLTVKTAKQSLAEKK